MLFAFFLGILIGTITGIIPGLHSNLIAALLVSIYPSGVDLGIMLIAMAVMHIFIAIIPSIYLSLPDETTAVSLLPGQRLAIEGRGYTGVMAHAAGAIFTILVLTPFLFFVVPYLPFIQSLLAPVISLVLALVLISFLTDKFAWRLLVIALAGSLGILTMNSTINEPLLPLLSGLFGIPALMFSFIPKIPKQFIKPVQITNSMRIALPLGWLAGSVVGFLPGVGTAHAACIVGRKKCRPETMLMLLSSITAANFLFSIATSTALGRARNGVVALAMEYASISFPIYAATVLAAGGFAYIITRFFAQFFASHVQVLAQKWIKPCLLVFMLVLVLFVSGLSGILILCTATVIGLIPLLLKIERSILMSCLVVPVLILLWP